jgi:hypothetical protein
LFFFWGCLLIVLCFVLRRGFRARVLVQVLLGLIIVWMSRSKL